QEESPAQSTGTFRPLADRCILLADDGPENLQTIGQFLAHAGAEVIFANDGQSVMEMVTSRQGESARIDLILIDMQMPVLDGYQTTTRLRRAGFDGPIIALGTHSLIHDRQRCLDVGCDDCAPKPV